MAPDNPRIYQRRDCRRYYSQNAGGTTNHSYGKAAESILFRKDIRQ
eukprot:XP_001708210.1 Hypothetical protein GL50803_34744 [Giardia lamblia ATCC 50803]